MELYKPDTEAELGKLMYAADLEWGENHQMLIFTSDGVALLHHDPTGESEHRTIKAGEHKMMFNVPTYEAGNLIQFASINEAVAFLRSDSDSKYRRYTIDIDEVGKDELAPAYAYAKELAEAVFKAAEDIIWDGETLQCKNCKGEGEMTSSCMCRYGYYSYTDMEDGTTVSDANEDNSAKDDCPECGGRGESTNNCPVCHGAKYKMRYPTVTYKNAETEEQTTVKFNLAHLVASDQIPIDIVEKAETYNYGFGDIGHATISLVLHIDEYIEDKLLDIDIDIHDAKLVRDGKVHYADRKDFTLWSTTWNKNGDDWEKSARYIRRETSENEPAPTLKMKALSLLVDAQEKIAEKYQWVPLYSEDMGLPFDQLQAKALRYGRKLNQDKVVVETIEAYRPASPATEVLGNLIAMAEANGYQIGYTRSFIATGETAPSFYLMTSDNETITQLSNDHDYTDALENALYTLSRFLARPNNLLE